MVSPAPERRLVLWLEERGACEEASEVLTAVRDSLDWPLRFATIPFCPGKLIVVGTLTSCCCGSQVSELEAAAEVSFPSLSFMSSETQPRHVFVVDVHV